MPDTNVRLNRPTLERLLLYYHFIHDHLGSHSGQTVSSARIAELLYMDDAQVRKDLAAIGVKGHPHVGFDINQVLETIRRKLGFNAKTRAVVIGAGRLGGAVASYDEFVDYGLEIVALFDNNPQKIGLLIGRHVVQPAQQMEAIIQQHEVELGIITTPAGAAQGLADRFVRAGVPAIWNFAPVHLVVPPGVMVRHEHLAVGLAELSYHLNRRKTEQTHLPI